MIKVKNILYLIYYVRKTEWRKLTTFLNYASDESGKNRLSLVSDMVFSALKNKISFIDYFYFRFWEKSECEREAWAGTGFMYEYQLLMNPAPYRVLLEDKALFLKYYSHFIDRKWATLDMLQKDNLLTAWLLSNPTDKVVLKNAKGQCGKEVEVINTKGLDSNSLINYMRENNFDLLEEYVVQHPSLMKLSPRGLNTIRIITQVENGQVELVAARLRISIHSAVDNLAAGNIAAAIDITTGRICSGGVYSDITKKTEHTHPLTHLPIPGFQLPHWKEVIEKATQIALVVPQNRSVGWDIAITEKGVELIEGNHNWCKLLWQLPVNRGLKHELLHFLTTVS